MKYLYVLLSLLLVSCSSSNDDEVINEAQEYLSATEVYKEVSGVSPDLLSLDIYYRGEVATPKPVVIYVHGGAWSIGDKASQIDHKVSLFESLDYVLVSINYRLSPSSFDLTDPDRVMFPTHNEDVADAIKWVHDHIPTYGGNPNKIALLGHSAGAHLVALTGTNPTFLEGVGLGFEAIAGIAAIDTEGYNVLQEVAENSTLYINAFGTNSTLNEQASPLLNVLSGPAYPQFFIAKRGNARRIATADAFIHALEENGTTVWQLDGSIYDHSGINHAIGEANETVITPALTDFFDQCFQ